MIFVNYGSGGYAQFEHAPWHGITFADVVFPFFVWMLGTSLIFSFRNAIDKGASKRTLLKRVAIRTLKLLVSTNEHRSQPKVARLNLAHRIHPQYSL